MDGYIPYRINHECELKFIDLDSALELDPILEPKLIFQELILFRDDLDVHTPPKEQVNHIVRMNVIKMNFYFKQNLRMDLINFVRRFCVSHLRGMNR